jgi:hypothetical protein
MKCPDCGAENPGSSTYCESCAGPLEQIQKVNEKPDTRNHTKLIIAAVIVGAILVLAGFVGVFYTTPPRTMSVWVIPGLGHNPGGVFGNETYNGTIYFHGTLHNSGNKDAYPVLIFTIADTRGWSISDTRSQGIVPAGGSLDFSWDYTWPYLYNGITLNWTFDPYFAELTMTVTEA